MGGEARAAQRACVPAPQTPAWHWDDVPTHPSHARIALRYLAAVAGCIAFNLIYAQFAHGVSSVFMTFMFAIPLVAGVVPAFAMHLVDARSLPLRCRQAWALAIACLTVASCLHGVFDIAGTASPWLFAYLVAAALFAVIAMVSHTRYRAGLSR
jgi:hypothetical protein